MVKNISDGDLSKQKKILRELMYSFLGAVIVLLVTAITERGCLACGNSVINEAIMITPWFGPWILVQVLSVFLAIGVLIIKEWKPVPFEEKASLFFGYTAIAWASLLALVLRLAALLHFMWYLLILVLGSAWMAGFIVHRLRQKRIGDDFP